MGNWNTNPEFLQSLIININKENNSVFTKNTSFSTNKNSIQFEGDITNKKGTIKKSIYYYFNYIKTNK